ncbi:MAG: ABC-2 transporter permease [Ruminococcus sp.]|nr:ABC-2 transporter permease [Ruminococcus sp.]
MKGLLYKEFRQNLPSYITSFAIIPFMILLYTFTFSFIEGKYESLEHGLKIIYSSEGYFILILTYVMGFLVADTISSKTLTNDEFKKWAYFISSTPALSKGQVIVKYISSFIISMICMISLFLTDTFMSMAVKKYEIEMLFDAKKLFIPLFLVMIVFRAVDIPFVLRFNSKKGSAMKGAVLGVLFVAVLIYLLFGPLPTKGSELLMKIMEISAKFQMGVYNKLIIKIEWISAAVVAVLYVLSYFISTKLYLKGIETYDK